MSLAKSDLQNNLPQKVSNVEDQQMTQMIFNNPRKPQLRTVNCKLWQFVKLGWLSVYFLNYLFVVNAPSTANVPQFTNDLELIMLQEIKELFEQLGAHNHCKQKEKQKRNDKIQTQTLFPCQICQNLKSDPPNYKNCFSCGRKKPQMGKFRNPYLQLEWKTCLASMMTCWLTPTFLHLIEIEMEKLTWKNL